MYKFAATSDKNVIILLYRDEERTPRTLNVNKPCQQLFEGSLSGPVQDNVIIKQTIFFQVTIQILRHFIPDALCYTFLS